MFGLAGVAALGPFRFTNALFGGKAWKIRWRLSPTQKARQRKRLRAVDGVVQAVEAALARQGRTLKALDRWRAEMPTEPEMLPKDKYTVFSRYATRYRKNIRKMPKWTKISQRINPPGY